MITDERLKEIEMALQEVFAYSDDDKVDKEMVSDEIFAITELLDARRKIFELTELAGVLDEGKGNLFEQINDLCRKIALLKEDAERLAKELNRLYDACAFEYGGVDKDALSALEKNNQVMKEVE